MERDRIVEEIAPFRTGAEDRSRAKSLMVVATQCLEVGVDLDLDGLVTQAARPSMRCVRGSARLNRAGRCMCAEGVILARAEDIAAKADDPVYGERIRRTWEALGQLAGGATVDFGVNALPPPASAGSGYQRQLSAPRCARMLRSSCRPTSICGHRHHRARRSDPDVELFLCTARSARSPGSPSSGAVTLAQTT